ncbi:MAG: CpaD family pilus assembly lipoprotein, partial [Pseudomonadota bacterium]
RYLYILSLLSLLVACAANDKLADSPKVCPDWSKISTHDYRNKSGHSNFGCAYYSNITTQLQNPEDYKKGTGKPTIDAERDSAIIQGYSSSSAASSSSGAAAAVSAATR